MSHLDPNAQMLANDADVAATIAGGNFAGKPARLIAQALQVDPQNPMAPWLASTRPCTPAMARKS